MIGERRAAILSLIIDSYIKTGEPIGSKTISNLLPYQISSATIRNEMAYLSELGFLQQMHTSGGRVPSNASFRYYVDHLMRPKQLDEYEKERIASALSVNASDPERLLRNASVLLAQVSGCAAFYNIVKDELDCVQGVDIIPTGGNKAMLVMLSVGGKIKSSICRLSCPLDDDFKALFYYIAAEYFVGTPLTDINLALIQSTAPVLKNRLFDMLPVLTTLCSICSEAADGSLHIEGETNLLSHTELGSGVYKLLTFLTAKDQIADLLLQYAKHGREKELFIGEENYHPELKNTATAMARFNYNNSQTAVLGIIGSTRIDYASVLPRVEYIMNIVKEFLQKGGAVIE